MGIYWTLFTWTLAPGFTYTEPVPLKYGKLATKYIRIYWYFSQCMRCLGQVSDGSGLHQARYSRCQARRASQAASATVIRARGQRARWSATTDRDVISTTDRWTANDVRRQLSHQLTQLVVPRPWRRRWRHPVTSYLPPLPRAACSPHAPVFRHAVPPQVGVPASAVFWHVIVGLLAVYENSRDVCLLITEQGACPHEIEVYRVLNVKWCIAIECATLSHCDVSLLALAADWLY